MLKRLESSASSEELGEFLVTCIESKIDTGRFEGIPLKSTSGETWEKPCIDEYFDWLADYETHRQRGGGRKFAVITRVPGGSRGRYIDSTRKTIDKYGMAALPVTLAPVFLYHTNRSAFPWNRDCTSRYGPIGENVNCLSHTLDNIRNEDYGTLSNIMPSIAPLLSFDGCRFNTDVTDSKNDPDITCLNKVISEFPADLSSQIIFDPNVDLLTPCTLSPVVASRLSKEYSDMDYFKYRASCIQYIVDDYAGRVAESSHLVERVQENPMFERMMGQKIFVEPDRTSPVSGLQYLLDGYGAWYGETYAAYERLFFTALKGRGLDTCTTKDGREVSCIDHIIDTAVESTSSGSRAASRNVVNIITALSRSREFIDNAMMSNTCFDPEGNRISCIDKIISVQPQPALNERGVYDGGVKYVFEHDRIAPVIALKEIAYRIHGFVSNRLGELEESGDTPDYAPEMLGKAYEDTDYQNYPPLDLDNTVCRMDDRPVSCIDKVFSQPVDVYLLMEADPPEEYIYSTACTDDNGNNITCIDKLVGTKEFGNNMQTYMERNRHRELSDDEYKSLRSRFVKKYNFGDVKIKRFLQDIRDGNYKTINMICHRINPKIEYKMVENIRSKTSCLDRIVDISRKDDIDSILKSSLPLDIEACLKTNTTYDGNEVSITIPCIQKIIDRSIAEDRVRGGFNAPDSMVSLLMMRDDIYKNNCVALEPSPETGIAPGKRISCIMHIIESTATLFGVTPDKVISPDAAANILISGKLKALPEELVGSGGKTYKTRDIICGNITMVGAIAALQAREQRKSSFDVTEHGHKTLDGQALAIVSGCKCGGIEDPVKRRACADDVCFNQYSRKYDYIDEWMSMGSIYKMPDDPMSIAGVYAIKTNKPDIDAIRYYNEYVGLVYSHIQEYFVTTTKYKGKDVVTTSELIPPANRITQIPRGGGLISVEDYDSAEQDFRVKINYIGEGNIVGSSEYNFSSLLSDKVLKAFPEFNSWISTANDAYTREIKKLVKSKPTRRDQAFTITISRRPADFIRASTCQNWASCMNLNTSGGEHRGHILNAFDHGSYIAYIASDELSTTWLGRCWLHIVKPWVDLGGRTEADFPKDTKCMMKQPYYGLKPYKNIFEKALEVILKENDVNTTKCITVPSLSPKVQIASSNAFVWKDYAEERTRALRSICARWVEEEKIPYHMNRWEKDKENVPESDAKEAARVAFRRTVKDQYMSSCTPQHNAGGNAINNDFRKYAQPGELRKLKYEVWLDAPRDYIKVILDEDVARDKAEFGENFVVKLRPVTEW